MLILSECSMENTMEINEVKVNLCSDNTGIDKNSDEKLNQVLFSCQLCSKELKTRISLKAHLKRYHKFSPLFNCGICHEKCQTHKELLLHRNGHKDNEGKFVCNMCNKKILIYSYFVDHLKSHNNESKSNSDNSLNCSQCNEMFVSTEELMMHKELERLDLKSCVGKRSMKMFACDTCGKRFLFACLLRDHINLHEGLKPYSCQKCNKDFSQKASLKQHMRTHKEVHPYLCQTCSKGFYTRGDLKKHERIHTKERPYVCEICGEGFTQSSHLSAHRRSHTRDRPHQCDLCSKKFSKKGDLVRHKRIHSGELPYLCQVCGKKFRQSYQCQNHIRNHHTGFETLEAVQPLKITVETQHLMKSSLHQGFLLKTSSHDVVNNDSNFINNQLASESLSNCSEVRAQHAYLHLANTDVSSENHHSQLPMDVIYEYYSSDSSIKGKSSSASLPLCAASSRQSSYHSHEILDDDYHRADCSSGINRLLYQP